MSRELPSKPNLEFLRKQAKELLPELQRENASAKLADAQHTLARDYGFASWPKLKEHVEELARVLSPAEMLAAAVRASDAARVSRVLASHPELQARINEPMANYGAGMQAMLAAVQRTDRATIDVLLAAGADINARSHWWAGGIGVLDECLPELAPFLMERGAMLDAHSAARLGMLGYAAGTGAGGPGRGGHARRQRPDAVALRVHRGDREVPSGAGRGD